MPTLNRDKLIKGSKIAIGGAVSIFIAERLGLEYATSTGIITLLTVQDTRKSTLRLSVLRFFSFALSMLLAGLSSWLLGFHAVGYGVYMLLLASITLSLGWDGTLSTNAVFGTHLFMMGKAMTMGFVVNEFGLLVLGTGAAVIMNLRMPDRERELRDILEYTEREVKQIIKDISEQMVSQDPQNNAGERIERLIEKINDALKKSMENRENTSKEHTEFYIDYFTLRKNQCGVLLHFYHSVMPLEQLPYTAEHISDFVADISKNFGVENDPAPRIKQMQELFLFFKEQPLPKDRDEFEARATLYHGLKELEEYFTLKQDFMARLTPEQKRLYLDIRKKKEAVSDEQP